MDMGVLRTFIRVYELQTLRANLCSDGLYEEKSYWPQMTKTARHKHLPATQLSRLDLVSNQCKLANLGRLRFINDSDRLVWMENNDTFAASV